MSWFDTKPVNLISSYVVVDPIDSVRRYDQIEKTYIIVPGTSIVKVYNTYMRRIEKLDMMWAHYKHQTKSRGWYNYSWLHSCDSCSSKFMVTLIRRPEDTW